MKKHFGLNREVEFILIASLKRLYNFNIIEAFLQHLIKK